jgi:hypothetical protein
MGQAHVPCNGMGWVGEGSEATPCFCNPNADGRPPEPARPGGNPNVTVTVVDDDTAVRDPNEEGQGPDGLFNPSQIAAQNSADLARMAKERRGLKAMEDRKEVR